MLQDNILKHAIVVGYFSKAGLSHSVLHYRKHCRPHLAFLLFPLCVKVFVVLVQVLLVRHLSTRLHRIVLTDSVNSLRLPAFALWLLLNLQVLWHISYNGHMLLYTLKAWRSFLQHNPEHLIENLNPLIRGFDVASVYQLDFFQVLSFATMLQVCRL